MRANTPWRLLRSGPANGAMNMALDDALLQAVAAGRSRPVLRLYRWQPAALTLGYAQPLDAGVDQAACRSAGIDVVRRPTGGRAVLHDHEVTYAVIAPVGAPFGTTVAESYRAIAAVLQAALCSLGLTAVLVPGQPRGRQNRAVCFTAPAQYELLVDGCKVAGCAQKRLGGAFLQHGSLPLDIDLERLARLLPGPPGSGTPALLESVGCLNRFSPARLEIATVEDCLIETFAHALSVRLLPDAPSSEELALARRLCAERYAHPEWTSGRSGRSMVIEPGASAC